MGSDVPHESCVRCGSTGAKYVAMATIFVFLYMGVHWRHLANTTEPTVCRGHAVFCQITLTTCYVRNDASYRRSRHYAFLVIPPQLGRGNVLNRVCLSVSRIAQKVTSEFSQNLLNGYKLATAWSVD